MLTCLMMENNMKFATAYRQLVKESEFLGLRFEDLIRDLELYPLSFPLRTIEAYRTYQEKVRA